MAYEDDLTLLISRRPRAVPADVPPAGSEIPAPDAGCADHRGDEDGTQLGADQFSDLSPTALAALAEQAAAHPALVGQEPLHAIEALIAAIDQAIETRLNQILHHPDFQRLEASWRGLHYLVRSAEGDEWVKVRVCTLSKQELARTLRKFDGIAWDQSPIFRRIYEEEYGQLGGTPYDVLVGDYEFDHAARDVQTLAGIARIAAAAHAPFIAGAAPTLMGMENWAELANPRDLTRIFATPEYAAWRALRLAEDTRYLGLCLPRVLARLPYGARSDPLDDLAFDEEVEGDARAYAWMQPAYAVAANIVRAFRLHGWCTRICGIETGGLIEDLTVPKFPTADGETDRKGALEIALSEAREAELARNGLIPLVQRKNTDVVAVISANSLQKPVAYDDEAATANAVMSARLPYLLASCRFAHYLKCIVRDKVGGHRTASDLSYILNTWLMGYVDGSPGTSSEAWKASHPLEAARVLIEEKPDSPGQYEAKFLLRPHYQLEGLTVALRLVSSLRSA